jgi:hypothetical protein
MATARKTPIINIPCWSDYKYGRSLWKQTGRERKLGTKVRFISFLYDFWNTTPCVKKQE